MKDVDEWVARIERMKDGDVDLSTDEDLSFALMNLVSLEEHFYFTAMKTGNRKYLDHMADMRELRKTFLARIVTDPVGEEWCISKHLLAASMRLYEVGCKERSRKGEGEEFFRAGFELWSLFFAINLKMIDSEELTEQDAREHEGMSRFSQVMRKIVDCCKEW